ncbi:MAG TPA: hypothetical protein VLA04_00565, partial [Verrucomicrobiae bacterium]|nr:hypothetical protein [Verrucomicrobiae bacterium]
VVDPKTKRVKSTLTLEATSGGFSDERDAIRATPSNSSGVTGDDKKPIAGRACLYEGGKWLSDNGTSGIDCLASGEMYDIKTGTTRPLTDEELKWYVTGRWPYVKTYWWDQSFNTKPHTVLNPAQPQKYFMGRKVVLYNPATNRAAVGVISEWGPAPWTGVTVKERAQQRTLWTSGPAGPQPRMQVPEGYTGRVAGGGTAFTEYLGTVTDTPIVLGYLRQDLEDKTPLGPLTNFTVSKQGAVTVDGSNDSSCAELGNHSRVRYDNPGRDKGYLLAGKGQNRTGGTSPINPHMCQLLVEYLNDSDNRSVVVKVSSITSGNHSPTSRHYSGNSIDIGNEDIAPSLMQWILANQAELKKKSLMPQQVIGPQKDSQWAVDGGKGRPGFYVAEHNNHVHIGF